MKKTLLALLLAPCLLAPFAAQAQAVYGGIGFPGATIGYDHTLTNTVSVRAEYTGGIKASKNQTQDGIDFRGDLKASTVGAFVDYYPTARSGFRATGGLTFNDTKASLLATGSNASAQINGKSVNLAGQSYNIEVKYPDVTPYLGVGYNSIHAAAGKKGWGYYIDAGVSIGKFKTTTTTTLVGVQGITQADVDVQTNKVSDEVSKLSVFPKIAVGVVYAF